MKRGARNLILVSRNAEAADNIPLLNKLKSEGCQAVAKNCDISDAADLEKMVKECDAFMPPIRGVIQAAMVLKVSIECSNVASNTPI